MYMSTLSRCVHCPKAPSLKSLIKVVHAILDDAALPLPQPRRCDPCREMICVRYMLLISVPVTRHLSLIHSSALRRGTNDALSSPLLSYPDGFGAIVDQCLFEPGMFQGFFCCYSILRIIDEDLSEEVEELSVEGCVCWDEFLCNVSVVRVAWVGGDNIRVDASWPSRTYAKPWKCRCWDIRASLC
jgi:hypothetical protein